MTGAPVDDRDAAARRVARAGRGGGGPDFPGLRGGGDLQQHSRWWCCEQPQGRRCRWE